MDNGKIGRVCGAIAGGVFLIGTFIAFLGMLMTVGTEPTQDASNLKNEGVNTFTGDAGNDYDPVERGLFAGLLRENIAPTSVHGGVSFDFGNQRISYPMTFISISAQVYPENYIICLPDSEGQITPYALMRGDGDIPYVSAAGQDLVESSGICEQFVQ